ncbi:males-absent on the first protein-like [Scaptodrosophila lebanonensis]|uniref:Histone acetyltransferase n=1 Tax=Drosophila lebanonensis TaxID=7225 RepID=A0A6J2TDL8_DROLE|nr:males-absent on the first protein-like [Scaptodrosophila lebanonensis]
MAQGTVEIKTEEPKTKAVVSAQSMQLIDSNDQPEKICYIRRSDGAILPGHVLQQRGGEKAFAPIEYYVHYVGLNRRLDEWVPCHCVSENADDLGGITVLSQPDGEQADTIQAVTRKLNDPHNIDAPGSPSDRKMTRYQKRRYDEINHVQKSHEELSAPLAAYEKEHESITKIKYIEKIQFGQFEIDTWYFSPYPDEYGKARKLFVCQYCLKYMRLLKSFTGHLKDCKVQKPPGREIYRKGIISVFEVDGNEEPLYCQLLCLLAKLFLDHKVLFYDTKVFYFYVLCEIAKEGCQIVGYFSKEKESLANNNVACILVLPPYQRKGYGKFLIAFSYTLSRKEGIIGSPEKPLSDLGRLSYRSYWAYTLLELMSDLSTSSLSIKALNKLSGIATDDIIYTLQSMRMIKYWKGQQVVCVTTRTINNYLQLPQLKRPVLTVDLDCLDWTPHKTVNGKSGVTSP